MLTSRNVYGPIREPQGVGEALHGISVGPPVLPALKKTDRIHAEPGVFRQVLLRKASRVPVSPQEIAEGRMLAGVQYSLSLTCMLRDSRNTTSCRCAGMIARRQPPGDRR